MSTHAPLPPSSAARIVACPGSRAVAEAYPEEDTIDSRQGTAVHWAGAELLRGDQIAVGQVADNGEVLNVEMVEAAEGYAEYIMHRDGDAWLFGCVAHVEELVKSGAVHPENYGTPDYWMFDHRNHLFVDDFKYGYGFVSEQRNYQLINYVALIAKHLGVYWDDSLTVTMTIHQPRCPHRRGPVRSVTTTLGALRYPILELSSAFAMAMAPDAPVIARDPDQCRNCPGRHDCEALLMEEGPAIDLAYSSSPITMSPAARRKEYQRLVHAEKVIRARRDGIEQSILSTIQRGGIVPGFVIAHGKGRKVWKEDAVRQGVIEIAQSFNATITKPGLITPLQAIKAGIPEDVVNAFTHTPGGAAELVEDDGTFAANVFNKE